ncbi:MAG: hypothetical protein EBZ77_06270 [Chitinophagia bacterium]|nr:hypothetical protein [Chitinophagia bacterium]
MSNTGTFIGQVTADQIAAWKKSNPQGIYGLTSDGHIAYFRNPTRHDMNSAMASADKEAALTMFEVLADTTFLGGSEEMLKDDQLFLGMVDELKKRMDGRKAKLVNL